MQGGSQSHQRYFLFVHSLRTFRIIQFVPERLFGILLEAYSLLIIAEKCDLLSSSSPSLV